MTDTKLYVVEIERTMLVLATSEREAERIAEENERDEAGNHDYCTASLATGRNIPRDWYDSHPYADEYCGKTVRQILADIEEAERLRPPTAQELEAAGQQRLIE